MNYFNEIQIQDDISSKILFAIIETGRTIDLLFY